MSEPTVFDIRPHRGGWQCFEAPGVQPYFINLLRFIDGFARDDAGAAVLLQVGKDAVQAGIGGALAFQRGEFRRITLGGNGGIGRSGIGGMTCERRG